MGHGVQKSDVTLRPATTDDLELMFAWRNTERIYEHFEAQDGPLVWEDHVEWFDARPPDRDDFIIEYGGRRVGAVAIAADGDVGIYIGDSSIWRQGVATMALRSAIDRYSPDVKLTAKIHRDNEASRRLFEKVGFEQTRTDGEWLVYAR